MSIANHRIAAGAILLCACLGLAAIGRTLIEDSAAVAQVRTQLAGKWVATRLAVTPEVMASGSDAAATTVEFSGREVHFSRLIDAGMTNGVYNLDPTTHPGKIDFKVTAGWVMGIYRLDGDQLTLAVNSLTPPEQLGVPARGRPQRFDAGQGRFVYEFHRVAP